MFIFNRVKGDHLFSDVDAEIRSGVIKNIIEASAPRKSFFAMIAISSIVCTAGILMNSVPLIIGSMLVAPMLSAILAVSLGLVVLNNKLFFRSIVVVFKSVLLLFVSAFVTSMFFGMSQEFSYVFYLKPDFQIEIFLIALIVGFAASLSFVRKELSQYVTGTAIAVTLIPPVTISAVALRMGYLEYFKLALWIFVINFVGIIISSILVFLFTRFHYSQKTVEKELKEEAVFLDKMTRRDKLKKWIYEGHDLLKKSIRK